MALLFTDEDMRTALISLARVRFRMAEADYRSLSDVRVSPRSKALAESNLGYWRDVLAYAERKA
jgi:hypothetical protein